MTEPPPTAETPEDIRPLSRRARLGWSGVLFIFVTVFLAIGAINSQNNLLFWVFGVAVSAVIISGVVSGYSLLGLRMRHAPIPDTPVGTHQDIPYHFFNRNRLLPIFALTIREAVSNDTGAACLLHIQPAGRAKAHGVWTPSWRGPRLFDRIIIESRFPFGFIIKSLEFSVPRRALATPATLRLADDLLDSLGDGQTEHRVKRARRGVVGAYFGLRAYSPGDPRRTIAWRPSARRSELLVVEHAEPRGPSIWVHLPRPTPVEGQDIMPERAMALAAALVRAGTHAGRAVGIWAPWAGIRLRPATGTLAEKRAARALAMTDLSDPQAGDSEPPIGPGESSITIPLRPAGGPHPGRLDPARPEDWLAPGATLPPALAGSSAPARSRRARRKRRS
ncbi:MAG: DUF58 domain-containing protein [Phycisphaerales bacterium]|nr:DUF58 domain-containing protein [Planctomycetota bacterium]MCH8507779.1 DUF58 domain-containing protein [Phycisphaerales bacterium]